MGKIMSRLFRGRDAPKDRTAGSAYSFFLGGSSSGKRVNERTAMQMTAVYSCVRILSEAVAGLPPSEVLHVPGLGFDGLVGYSPIAMAKNAVGLAIAAEEYGSSFFANGAAPGGVLEHPGTIKDPARVRESWTQTFGGSGNANKIAVLEEGMK